MKIAAVNWKIRPIQSASEFTDHAIELLDTCKAEGTELVVFPECFTLELLALLPNFQQSEIAKLIPPSSLDSIVDYCQKFGMSLIAGSTFFKTESGFVNASKAIWPDGRAAIQLKIVLTQFELNEWKIEPGNSLAALPDPRFGITICYDCEFPEAGRALAESGVLCQVVPALTQDEHGFWRVRNSCLARAIENQIFVVHSSLVGSLSREPVPSAVGSSAIIAPSIEPFPDNGILAESDWNEESVAVAELDFEAIFQARESGDVRNWNDRNRGSWKYD